MRVAAAPGKPIAATIRRPLGERMVTALRPLSRHYLAMAGVVLVIIALVMALGAPWLAPYEPQAIDYRSMLHGPTLAHPIGTDDLGRDILVALRDGRTPDYSKGFASRPQLRGAQELAGSEYSDGWGAHCYRLVRDRAANDASFRSWTCARGLACQTAGTARMGMCFVKAP